MPSGRGRAGNHPGRPGGGQRGRREDRGGVSRPPSRDHHPFHVPSDLGAEPRGREGLPRRQERSRQIQAVGRGGEAAGGSPRRGQAPAAQRQRAETCSLPVGGQASLEGRDRPGERPGRPRRAPRAGEGLEKPDRSRPPPHLPSDPGAESRGREGLPRRQEQSRQIRNRQPRGGASAEARPPGTSPIQWAPRRFGEAGAGQEAARRAPRGPLPGA